MAKNPCEGVWCVVDDPALKENAISYRKLWTFCAQWSYSVTCAEGADAGGGYSDIQLSVSVLEEAVANSMYHRFPKVQMKVLKLNGVSETELAS